MYDDVLPTGVKQKTSQHEQDAFHLFLFSYDLQYVYKKYGDAVSFLKVGEVKAVKFKGNYYRFEDDPRVLEAVIQKSPLRSRFSSPNHSSAKRQGTSQHKC